MVSLQAYQRDDWDACQLTLSIASVGPWNARQSQARAEEVGWLQGGRENTRHITTVQVEVGRPVSHREVDTGVCMDADVAPPREDHSQNQDRRREKGTMRKLNNQEKDVGKRRHVREQASNQASKHRRLQAGGGRDTIGTESIETAHISQDGVSQPTCALTLVQVPAAEGRWGLKMLGSQEVSSRWLGLSFYLHGVPLLGCTDVVVPEHD